RGRMGQRTRRVVLDRRGGERGPSSTDDQPLGYPCPSASSGRSLKMPHQTHAHLDPRSPLVLDTRDLPRRPGAMRARERTGPAAEDLGLEPIGVPPGAALPLRLRLGWGTEGVLVSVTVSGPVAGECGRCLRPLSDTIDVEIQELYAYEHSTTEETTDE